MNKTKEEFIINQLSSKLAVPQSEIEIITDNGCLCGIVKIGDTYKTFIVK